MILPIFDRNGREIIAGARVRYCLPDYYINVKSGTGTVVSTDEYGGVYYDADKPEPARLDRSGTYRETRQRQYAPIGRFDYDERKRIAVSELGGTETFMEVIDDATGK
jgi:hypothetical protein